MENFYFEELDFVVRDWSDLEFRRNAETWKVDAERTLKLICDQDFQYLSESNVISEYFSKKQYLQRNPWYGGLKMVHIYATQRLIILLWMRVHSSIMVVWTILKTIYSRPSLINILKWAKHNLITTSQKSYPTTKQFVFFKFRHNKLYPKFLYGPLIWIVALSRKLGHQTMY